MQNTITELVFSHFKTEKNIYPGLHYIKKKKIVYSIPSLTLYLSPIRTEENT